MSKKILVIFAHPLLEKSRVNRTLVKKYNGRNDVTFNDLYEMYPDFNIDIEFEKNLLLKHDLIILHHPLYWYSCPPLMKQWIDLVLEVGWAYGPGGDALKGKSLMQIITTGGQKSAYSDSGSNKHSLREFLLPFEQTALLCKMTYIPPYVIHGTHRLTDEEIDKSAAEMFLLLDLLVSDISADEKILLQDYSNNLLKERDGR